MYSFKWLLLSEIPNMQMNIRSAGIWANQPSVHPSNWKSSLTTELTQTIVQGRFRNKWKMVRRSSIQTIQAQYVIRFWIKSTTNLNMSVFMKQLGCWMCVLFTNHQMTVFKATSIQFQGCLEQNFWRTRLWPSGSSWGDGFGILICQEHWW